MESLGNICGEKWLWEGNAHMHACAHAHTHTHTHTHTHRDTSYLKCTRQSADSYLTRVSLDRRLLESKDWGFWLLNSQHYWVNYQTACWTQKDSGMCMWQCLSTVTPDCLRFASRPHTFMLCPGAVHFPLFLCLECFPPMPSMQPLAFWSLSKSFLFFTVHLKCLLKIILQADGSRACSWKSKRFGFEFSTASFKFLNELPQFFVPLFPPHGF